MSRELFQERLRNRISTEEFDYQTLLNALREYANPRDKITSLLRNGLIIRVKKGLYVFGEAFRRRPISRELLANLIYGPSYISLEYALSLHGLIPERVETITSVVYGRSRIFDTPAGRFTYRRISPEAYSVGMSKIEAEGEVSYLAAAPEKALADLIVADRGTALKSGRAMETYLLDHLRIDGGGLRRFDTKLVSVIARRYRSRKIRVLAEFLKERKSRNRETSHE